MVVNRFSALLKEFITNFIVPKYSGLHFSGPRGQTQESGHS